MRILFSTVAVRTHLYLIAPLAWACRAAGHEVRVASQPSLTPAITGIGLPAVEVGHGADVMQEILKSARRDRRVEPSMSRLRQGGLGRSADPGTGSPAAGLSEAQRELRDQVLVPWIKANTTMAPDLLRFAERWQPEIVITDPLLFAAPLISASLGIPLLRHLWGPDTLRWMSHPMQYQQTPEQQTPDQRTPDQRTPGSPVQGQPADEDVRAQWPTGLAELYDRFGVPVRNDYAAGSVDPWPTSLQLPGTPGRIPMRFVPYNGAAAAPDWVLDRASRPRVCVTWGVTTAMLGGDEAFALPRVVEALAPLDIEVVLAVSGDDRDKLGEVPPNCRIAENLPLHLLLPTCDAIVNQGGTSSLLTAACHGLPQVLIPQTADTPVNGASFSACGAGIALDVADATAESIAGAVTTALTSEAMRAAAHKLRDEIAATPPPSEVVHVLERLAHS